MSAKTDRRVAAVMGKNISAIRRQRSVTQVQLAAQVGLTPIAISYWETGRHIPDTPTLLRVCDFLGCTPSDIFQGWKEAL